MPVSFCRWSALQKWDETGSVLQLKGKGDSQFSYSPYFIWLILAILLTFLYKALTFMDTSSNNLCDTMKIGNSHISMSFWVVSYVCSSRHTFNNLFSIKINLKCLHILFFFDKLLYFYAKISLFLFLKLHNQRIIQKSL